MALKFTTNSIHAKLDDLSINSPILDAQEHMSPKIEPFSTKSLLSKSLAGDSSFRNKPPSPQMFPSIDSALFRDEHPEPLFLATSVGHEEGRFLPSSSTISLLSLSNNVNNNSSSNMAANTNPGASNNSNNLTSTTGNLPSYIELHFVASKLIPQTFTTASIERGSSFSNLRSRNSFNLSGQQRLQPYQKLTSSAIPSGAEFTSLTSPEHIPLKRNFSSLFIPTSPSLDPTSVANSPSGFWLNSRTPPQQLNITLKGKGLGTSSGTNYVKTAVPASLGTQEPPLSLHLVSRHINIQRSGSDSPILNPVQTPLEDTPMTPLYLNSDPGSYFVLSTAQQGGHRQRPSISYGFESENIDEKDEYDVTKDMELE